MDITLDAGHVILLVVALAGLGVAGGLLLARGRALAQAAAAQTEAAAARADAQRIEMERARLEADLGAERAGRAEDVSRREARIEDLSARNHMLEIARAQLEKDLDATMAQARADLARAQEVYHEQVKAHEQRERDLQTRMAQADQRAEQTFKALAADALKQTSTSFLELAKQTFATEQERARGELEQSRQSVQQMVKPIGETLQKTEARLAEIERQRLESFAALSSQVRSVTEAAGLLGQRTEKLREALSKPQVRGRYGEIQLQRVVEVAGMKNYCGDYAEQESLRDSDGRALRPDMTIRLPNDRTIVIDSKANIGAYVEALDAAGPDEAEHHLQRFAGHVADQVAKLAAKSYWDQFEKTPEFVVMFIPGDQFIDAALQRRPELFELAAQKKVILASPSTLIGLLRAVELGWREQRLAEETVELRRLGVELHERACVAFKHLADLGRSIEGAAKKYNAFVSSYESRLEPTLKRFEESGVKSGKELAALAPVEVRVRVLTTPASPPATPALPVSADDGTISRSPEHT